MKKKNPKWSPEELALFTGILTDREIAEKTGRSQPAVRGQRQRLAAKPADTTLEQDKVAHNNSHWQREYDALMTKYRAALAQSCVSDQLVALARELAPQSYHPAPMVIRRSSGKGTPQSAVLLLSDTHVGQVISPDQTLGFGGYNFEVFLDRLFFLQEGVASIIQDHTTTRIDELVLCIGGDMIDGALAHGAEAKQKNTLFQQFYGAGHALAQFIRNLAPLVPKIRVKTVVGNHPRWGTQHKMPTDNRYSNLDCFLSAYVQALTADIQSVEWTLDKQPFSLFDVQGFRFHLSHGDHLRGGDKALGVPNHAVGRMVSSTTQLYGKANEPAPHYYLLGHLHRGIQLPHARGSVLVNGGFPGIDGYGLMSGFSPVDPSQLFFLVHPKFGKTATYDIQLRFAKGNGYLLPKGFECV